MAKTDTSVLVVGAGPTGLMAASELKRRGIDCRIIDKLPTPTDKSKALVMHARTLELFETIGIADRFVEKGSKLHGASVFADGKRIIHLNFDELDSPFAFALAIPQSDTEAVLNQHIESLGLKVERPVELVAFEQNNDFVTATLKHADGREEKVTALYLIGCDGAHSTVRHTLEFAFEGATYPQTFALADVHVAWNHHDDEVTNFFSEDGVLAFFPMGNSRFRILAEGEGAEGPGEAPTMEQFQKLCDKYVVGGAKLSNAVWLAYFKINRRSVNEYRKGRVFVCGDAGHIHSPVGGQGMNTGLQDAFNLVWKLSFVLKGQAPESLLDTYQEERHSIAKALLAGTEMATKVTTLRSPVAQKIRNTMGPLLMSLEVIQQRLINTGSMLSVNYHNSSIVGQYRGTADHGGVLRSLENKVSTWLELAHGPAPGDRCPDATVRVDNKETTLFKCMAGTGFNLLVFPGESAKNNVSPPMIDVISMVHKSYPQIKVHVIAGGHSTPEDAPSSCTIVMDTEREAHHKFGVASECLYLVRPDGFVGFRSQPGDAQALQQHLAKLLVAEGMPVGSKS